MWKPKQQLNFSTRNWLCKVCFAALCFGFAAVPAKADLTQADIQAAVYQALVDIIYSQLGENDGPFYTVPVEEWGGSSLADFLSVGTPSSVAYGIGSRFEVYMSSFYPYIKRIGSTSNDLQRVVSLLSGLSGLGVITNGWGYTTADTLHGQMDMLEYYLQGIWSPVSQMDLRTDTHGDELLVAAPDLEDGLDDIITRLYAIETLIYDSNNASGVNISSNVWEMGDYIGGSISNQTAAIVDYFDQDVSTDYDAGQEEGSEDSDYDDYDDIPLPTSQEDYTTRADATQGPTTDDILENVSSSGVSHSPILQLVAAPSRLNPTAPIPEIEVDFGRDAPFASFCLALNDLTDWLYPILGMLLFSLKGVNMWRLVRQASIAASASGDVPVIHLAYDPF